MNKRIISMILLVSMLIFSLFGCSNFTSKKAITADTPYYSVTTGSYEQDRNVYMDLDIKIPKITYSNTDGNELMDSLNKNIESSLKSLIDEAKNKALSTYESYLQSAKDNARRDIENRIAEIENKYKSVIGDTEKEILSNLSADDISNFSFSNMGRMNTFPNRIASFSEMFPNMRRRFNQDGRQNNKSNESIVNGFTGTDELIIPGLHNKNIIVVETTTAAPTETSIKISGRPGISASEDSNSSFDNSNNEFERPKRSSWSNGTRNNFDGEFKKQERNTDAESKSKVEETKKRDIVEEETTKEVGTKSEIDKKRFTSEEKNETNRKVSKDTATKSEIQTDDGITLENFYRDLRRIRRFYVPDDFSLAIQYIPTTIECNYEVKCLDEEYLSLFVELSETRTTSSVKRLFYNVDLNKKKIVNLKDVLGDKYKETTVKYITEAIDKWDEEHKATLIQDYNIENYISENTPFFINNNHRPVIEIEKFVITIGSTGYHEFQIP